MQKNCISTLLSSLQNPSKFRSPHILTPINGIYLPQLHSILRYNRRSNKPIYKRYTEQLQLRCTILPLRRRKTLVFHPLRWPIRSKSNFIKYWIKQSHSELTTLKRDFREDLFSRVIFLRFRVDLISQIGYPWIFCEDFFSRMLVLSMFYIFWFFRGLFFS